MYKNKSWLYEQYITNSLSTVEIGDFCDVADSTIGIWLKKHEIVVRNPSQMQLLVHSKKRKKYMDKDWLYYQYIELGHTGVEIAQICGCGSSTIYCWLEKLGIERRPIAETLRVWYENNEISEEVRERMSSSHIGLCSGDKHPNWKDGISFEPYCEKFNEEKREEIRNRDHRVCQLCGKSEILNGKRLSVHHIDGDKMQGCNGKKWYLVALCNSCNSKKDTLEKEFVLVVNMGG